MSGQKPLRPNESFQLESGLSLVPRIQLRLTIHRADKSVSPIDEWKLKRSLIEFLKSNYSVEVPEDDVVIRKYKDLKKRKREDPVARGKLVIRDLGFLDKILRLIDEDEVEKKFLEWRRGLLEKMDGMELNLEGVKFKLSAELPMSDDFEGMRKEWEEIAAFGTRGYSRGDRLPPDTIVLRGAPSRWFAEPRVSSKPSMLVSHTIFSAFGKIRKLDVAEDNDIGKDEDDDDADIVSGLQCKIIVQFEKHKDFYNALKVFSGRSLQKEGSRLKADYEVTWDKDGFFRNARSQQEERRRWVPPMEVGNYRRGSEGSRFIPDDARRKRFKE